MLSDPVSLSTRDPAAAAKRSTTSVDGFATTRGLAFNEPTSPPAVISADPYSTEAPGQTQASVPILGKPVVPLAPAPSTPPGSDQNRMVGQGGYVDLQVASTDKPASGNVSFGLGTTTYNGAPAPLQLGQQGLPQLGQQNQPGQPPTAGTSIAGLHPSASVAAQPATPASAAPTNRFGGAMMGGMGGGMAGRGALPSGPTNSRVDQSRARLAQKIDEAKDRAAAPPVNL